MQISLETEIASLHGTLKRLSRRFTPNSEEAADLVQDTILKALVYRHKFMKNTNLLGWLYTIMRNTFINRYRKLQRDRDILGKSQDLRLLNVEDSHNFLSGEREFAWVELCGHVDSLKDELRIPFSLHTSGYKYHEISEQLQLPMGTVKNRIFQARKSLQEQLV